MSRLPQIAIPTRKPYPNDLSDAEWGIIQPLLPKPKGFGHPRAVNLREILNGSSMFKGQAVNGKCFLMQSL